MAKAHMHVGLLPRWALRAIGAPYRPESLEAAHSRCSSKGSILAAAGHIRVMTDDNHPGAPTADSAGPPRQPAIKHPERDRSGPLGPEDTDAGPEGEYPDPDEYAGADDH
jgi:hypothetical protein